MSKEIIKLSKISKKFIGPLDDSTFNQLTKLIK